MNVASNVSPRTVVDLDVEAHSNTDIDVISWFTMNPHDCFTVQDLANTDFYEKSSRRRAKTPLDEDGESFHHHKVAWAKGVLRRLTKKGILERSYTVCGLLQWGYSSPHSELLEFLKHYPNASNRMIRNYFCPETPGDQKEWNNQYAWVLREMKKLTKRGLVTSQTLEHGDFPYPEEVGLQSPKKAILTYILTEDVKPEDVKPVETAPEVVPSLPEVTTPVDTKPVLFYYEQPNLDPLLTGAAKGMGLDPDQVVVTQLRKVVSQKMEEIFGEDRNGYLNDLLRAEIIRQVSSH